MAWMHRLANVLRRRDLNPEIDEELRFHLDSRIRDNIAAGMEADEARRDAFQRFGSRPGAREQTRDANVIVGLETTLQDVIFAARVLRKRPAFTLVALVTLALGIGANAAIFTIVRSVLLRPLPFPEPDELHVISYGPGGPAFWLYPGMSDRDYLAFRDADQTFDAKATFSAPQVTLTGTGDAVRLPSAAVTPDFFRVLRVNALAGRTFTPEDIQTGRDRVVLVADSLWRGRFGSDPGLLNRTINLDGVPHTVVGILPPGFSYPQDAVLWTPLEVRADPGVSFARPVIGRLKAGVSRQQAQAAFETFARTLPPGPWGEPIARVMPLHDAIVGDVRTPLWIFGGAVLFVLLIACANAANLVLMRAVSRRQEIATRLALGSSRGRLARQFLTEALLLSAAAGALGALAALWVGPALSALVPPGKLPRDIAIQPDDWVIAFTLGLSLLTGLVLGIAPLVQTTRDDHSAALREATASATRYAHRLRHGLVVAEVALTLVLLIGAGLLIKSFLGLRAVDPGFEPGRLMTMTIELPTSRYPSGRELNAFHGRLLQALSVIPDVVSAAAVNWLPLAGPGIRGDLQAEDRGDVYGNYNVTKVVVSPEYFRTIGIRLARGRAFTSRDDPTAPGVLLISASVAQRIWPNENPLGRRITLEDRPQARDWLTVVGVVDDVRQNGLTEAPVHAVYQPYAQVTLGRWLGYMTFLVRTNGQPQSAAPMMRAVLRQLDADLAPQTLATMEDVIDKTIAEPKFQTRLLGAFSLLALVLAAIGLYGVLAASVVERRREIAIRVALGADRAAVVRMVLGRMVVLTTTGIVLGLAGSLAITKVLARLLFNVTPTDAPTFAIGAGVLLGVSLLAAVVPARRASAVDPVVALRID